MEGVVVHQHVFIRLCFKVYRDTFVGSEYDRISFGGTKYYRMPLPLLEYRGVGSIGITSAVG
jgi:hypothetical protein